MHQQIILASSSTARIEYLNQENLDYVIQPHTLDESIIKKKKIPFENMVEQLAEMKARSIEGKSDKVIIGSDQILVCEGKLIDKPKTLKRATKNLMFLRNKKHRLISSVVVINNKQIIFKETKEAILKMKFIADKEIKNYISNNKKTAINCVGSYKIEENYKYKFIDIIKGDLETIMGFPIKNFIDRLKK